MYVTNIRSLEEYLNVIEPSLPTNEILLFRGQAEDNPLLPSIAREAKLNNNSLIDIEKAMLRDLKRRAPLLVRREPKTDWEWLVFAQHFGLKTRLLDWSSNPLIALWFACNSLSANDSVVYILEADNSYLVDIETNDSPFEIKRTRILQPPMNNERIVAQSGWFTAHKCSDKVGRFIALEDNVDMKQLLRKVTIKPKYKRELIKKVSVLGVNFQTVYGDLAGLCKHLNNSYLDQP